MGAELGLGRVHGGEEDGIAPLVHGGSVEFGPDYSRRHGVQNAVQEAPWQEVDVVGDKQVAVGASHERVRHGSAALRHGDVHVDRPEDLLRRRVQWELDGRPSGQGSRGHYQGFGLGLAISKRAAEALGWSISLKSEVGKGTDFEIRFKSDSVNEVNGD